MTNEAPDDGSAYGLTQDDLIGDWDLISGHTEVAKLIKKNGMHFRVTGMICDRDKETGKCTVRLMRIEQVTPS